LALNQFDRDLNLPGSLGGKSYYDTPIDINTMEIPSSKVVYLVTRQNEAQAPRTSLYNPMHKFCTTHGEIIFAKDSKPGTVLAGMYSEHVVIENKLMDYKESQWYKLTTTGDSPDIFVNMLITFPTTLEELQSYEKSLDSLAVKNMEYSGLETKEEKKFEPIPIEAIDANYAVK